MLGKKLSIDFGSITRLAIRGGGITVSGPTAVVTGVEHGASLFGVDAVEVAMRDPTRELIRPMLGGRINDAAALDLYFNSVLTKAIGRQRIFKPDIVFPVITGMSGEDRSELLEIAARAGARTSYLIDAPVAAAMGAALDITGPRGHMVLDLGAAKTECAIVAVEGTIMVRSVASGGDALRSAVAAEVLRTKGVRLSDATAADITTDLVGTAGSEERRMIVSGRDASGCLVDVAVTTAALAPMVDHHLAGIVRLVAQVLVDTPDPLRDDVERWGMVLTGGGAQFNGLDRHLRTVTGVSARVAHDPQRCAVRGALLAMDQLDVIRRGVAYMR